MISFPVNGHAVSVRFLQGAPYRDMTMTTDSNAEGAPPTMSVDATAFQRRPTCPHDVVSDDRAGDQ